MGAIEWVINFNPNVVATLVCDYNQDSSFRPEALDAFRVKLRARKELNDVTYLDEWREFADGIIADCIPRPLPTVVESAIDVVPEPKITFGVTFIPSELEMVTAVDTGLADDPPTS